MLTSLVCFAHRRIPTGATTTVLVFFFFFFFFFWVPPPCAFFPLYASTSRGARARPPPPAEIKVSRGTGEGSHREGFCDINKADGNDSRKIETVHNSICVRIYPVCEFA
jgi:hypothetical protein